MDEDARESNPLKSMTPKLKPLFLTEGETNQGKSGPVKARDEIRAHKIMLEKREAAAKK
jgi:hypothetical protein